MPKRKRASACGEEPVRSMQTMTQVLLEGEGERPAWEAGKKSLQLSVKDGEKKERGGENNSGRKKCQLSSC